MTAQTQPEALAQECADYATSLRSSANTMKLRGCTPPQSFLRAADLFERAAAEMALLNEVNAQLCEQNDSVGKACTELEAELVHEAQRTAAEKLRADQMTEQHRMQSAMNAEARGELAQLREKRQPTQLYRLLRSGELMREGDECLDDGTMTWHPVRNGWHSFPWSVINNPVRRVIEAAHNITGEPA